MTDTSSYLTKEEIDAIHVLPRGTPYLIRVVSKTQFSIARHYGGIKINGKSYVYMDATNELVRDDVVKFVEKLRKSKKPKPKPRQIHNNDTPLFNGPEGEQS